MRFLGRRRLRDSSGPTGRRGGWRSGLFLLSALGLFLLAFLTGFYLFFPNQTLKQRIAQEVANQTDLDLHIETLTIYPILTLDAEDIEIVSERIPWPILIDELNIAPRWLASLSGDPGVQIKARLLEGTLNIGAQKSGILSAQSAGLRFDLPFQQPIDFRIIGTLEKADLVTGTRLATETQTRLLLRFSALQVLGLNLAGDGDTRVDLGEILLQVEGKGRSMEIVRLTAGGGDLDLEGGGTVMIGRTAASSRIRLNLKVRPQAGLDPSLLSLFELAGRPDADGSYPLQVTGSLASPLLKPGG